MRIDPPLAFRTTTPHPLARKTHNPAVDAPCADRALLFLARLCKPALSLNRSETRHPGREAGSQSRESLRRSSDRPRKFRRATGLGAHCFPERTMRSIILVIGLLAIAACSDDIEKKEVLPTAPRKAAVTASPVAALKFDTTKASSLCKAAVRQSQRARIKLDQTPGDLPGQQKIKTLDALMSDACR
jgi:hypothetical protein